MSLDLYLTSERCESCERPGDEHASVNITYNLSPMWHAACPGGKNLVPIEGLTGEQAAPIVADALAALREEPEKFVALNPSNGWGSYPDLLDALTRIQQASESYPQAVWSAWR